MPTATINGFKHYWEDMGSGEVLVMLHGANKGNTSMGSFEEHWPVLSKRFRVVVPDMRSMGKSEHVKSMPPSAWVDDLLALLDHLDIPKAHIYGNSLGSRVAMRFAIEHPDRTLSILMTSPHTYLTPGLDQGQNKVGGDGTKLSPEDQAMMEGNLGSDWMEQYWNYQQIRNVVALQEYYNLRVSNPLMEVVYNFTESVTSIKCPILVIQSDNISRSRGSFDHALELKNDLPDQVKLAIVPAINPTMAKLGSYFSSLMIEFADSLLPVAAAR